MSEAPSPSGSPRFLPAITIGFGAAVAMWCIGFLTHLPGLRAPIPAVGVLLLAVQVLAGFVAVRAVPDRPVRAAGLSGFIAGCVNLLVLSSMLTPEGGSHPAHPALIAGAYVAASAVLAAVGAVIARALGVRASAGAADLGRAHWAARFAFVTALSAAPVILSGGLVTSADAGLAVHDWPGSYGVLMWMYPLSRMTGGVYYEHAHRLFGSLVGLTTIVLVVVTFVSSRRALPRIAVSFALLAVIAQGVMGGLRVTSADVPAGEDLRVLTPESVPDDAPQNYKLTSDNATSRGLAVVHGVFGQLTVAWLAVCAVVVSPRYASPRASDLFSDRFLRIAASCALIALLLQLVLGATTRHLHHMHVLMTHLAFAFIVVLTCMVAGLRAAKHRGTPVRRPGMALAHTVGLQLLLGFGTMFSVLPYDRTEADPWHAILLATVHHALGALLLASAAMVVVWTYRLTSPAASPAPLQS